MSATERFGSRLLEWRQRRRLSQGALGEKIGADGPRIHRLEKGSENPTLDTLDRLAAALGIDVGELLLPGPEEPGRVGRERNPVLEDRWRHLTEATDAEVQAEDSTRGDILRAIAVLGRALSRPADTGKAPELPKKARR